MTTYFKLIESDETTAFTTRELAEEAIERINEFMTECGSSEEPDARIEEFQGEADENDNIYDVENDSYIRLIK
jgi:hypothetical protein